MNPDKQQLLDLILRRNVETPALLPKNLRDKSGPFPDFGEWLSVLTRHLPLDVESDLGDYQYCALMGLTVGFCDRHLSPYLDEHTTIIQPLLDDIASVYRQIKDSGASYSSEGFIYRAYDYGIHKAYYLDWDLYLSHDMY